MWRNVAHLLGESGKQLGTVPAVTKALLNTVNRARKDPAWRGQSLKAEMMLQVQLLVFYPDRLTEPTAQAPVEGRCDDGFLPQLVRKLGDIVIRCILGEREQLQAANVHGLLAFFQPQEYLVYRA